MSTVTGVIIQHDVVTAPGTPCIATQPRPINPCGPDQTDPGFNIWNYSSNTNCVPGYTAYQCSFADACPVIGNIPIGSGKWVSNDDQFNTTADGRLISCTYNLGIFQTADEIIEWIDNFGTTGPNGDAFNTIMTNFCALPAPEGTCPEFLYSPTGSTACPAGLTGCSMLSSGSEGGALCRTWAISSPGVYSAGYYQAGANFCGANENICAIDCLCYNRIQVDPIYDLVRSELGPAFPVEDKCWYGACTNAPDKYLQPNDMTGNSGSCPNVCLQVIEIVNSNNVNVTVASQTISCPFNNGGTGTNPSNPSSLWDTVGVYVVIFGFVLLIIIVIIICIVIATYEKK